MPSIGLVDVSTEDLKKALRAVHRDRLPCPLDPAGVAFAGLQDRSGEFLDALRGLDRPAVIAVLTCVLAERLRGRL